jgi:penicillin G amidase
VPAPELIYGALRLALRIRLSSLRHRRPRQTIEQRIAAIPRQPAPIDSAVEISWNQHLVPFIEAQTDHDLAVALGLVHAHLRLAQMELLRRLAQGRLAEVLGPLAISIDHAFRLLDPGKPVAAILRDLPDETRGWLEAFVAGINHYIASAAEPPVEFRLLGISAEPWSVEHILQIGRLIAADVNWIVWLRLLWLARGPDWPQIWTRLLTEGTQDPALATNGKAATSLLLGLARSGSNALAVGGSRSATGCAWLGGDPHLALMIPGTWLAAAYRSPTYNVAGLMIPGIPVMAIGRNPWIAWGGTNLHAASSELFDVSVLPSGAITERRVRLKVRWSGERELVLRETEHGPVISDAPMIGAGRAIALRWMGHQPSDELSAMLALNRARDWNSFRRAITGYAVPGQTLLYADHRGHIGRLLAARLPRRPLTHPGDLISPLSAATAWTDTASSDELPAEFDPTRGFVVSANDRAPPAPVLVGWFFSPADRALRLAELVEAAGLVGPDDLRRFQQDVTSRSALALRDRLLAGLPKEYDRSRLLAALASWDGRYDAGSGGGLAFELVLSRLARKIILHARQAIYASVWTTRGLVAQDIAAVPVQILGDRVRLATREAEPAFARWRNWGAVHRLRLSHPLALVPGLRRRFRFSDWPWPGGNDTVMKAAHGPVHGPHTTGYGSNARYIFDLSDPDANRLVLLGGQDGAPSSAAFLDQAALFRRGETMRVPLRAETARAIFPYRTRIDPAS